MFKTWNEAYEIQQNHKCDYDNGMSGYPVATGIEVIDRIPYTVGDVVWLIMGTDYYLDDYEEGATEYGVTKDGRWTAIRDSHCSCYGWEAEIDNITYYDNLKQLLNCDAEAKVIVEYSEQLLNVFPFIRPYINQLNE